MQEIAIIHLSDLHLSMPPESNWILTKKVALLDAIARSCGGARYAVVVLSGDVANTGSEDEYKLANDLTTDIILTLMERCHIDDPLVVATPGNHDNSLVGDQSKRSVLLRASDDELTSSVVDDITSVENAFFSFANRVEEVDSPISGPARLCRTKQLTLGGKIITFNIINTAWTSTNPEKYGSLRCPPILHLSEDGDYVVTVLHHPISWLQADDGFRLRSTIETCSDLVLTGHVHNSKSGSHFYTNLESHYLAEAGPLQERQENGKSEFRVIKVNLWNDTQQVVRCNLIGELYSVVLEHDGAVLKNHGRLQNAFSPTDTFQDWLDDPGVGIQHPKVKNLKLRHFFVMPYLIHAQLDGRKKLIKSHETIDFVKNKKVLLFGNENSGKTSLLRSLARDLSRIGIVPCIIHGNTVTKKQSRDPDNCINESLVSQYGEIASQKYFGLDVSNRVLLIDDVHVFYANGIDIAKFVDHVAPGFGTIIITSSREHALQEFISNRTNLGTMASFEYCQITEFGFKQRSELVRKWMWLGNDVVSGESADRLDQIINRLCDDITDVIRRNYLPPYAPNLVLMLQTSDATRRLDESLGSYGYMYQRVIYDRLLVESGSVDPETKASFLAGIAGLIRRGTETKIPISMIRQWYEEYNNEYDVGFSWSEMWSSVSQTKLLRQDGDLASFRYPFCYCYFLALHISQQSRSDERAVLIQSLIDSIHLDESASTIVCLIQLTKEESIIDGLIAKARSIFSDRQCINLVEDTKFINALLNSLPTRSLPDDIGAARDILAAARDEQSDVSDELKQESAVGSNAVEPSGEEAVIITQFAAGYRVVQCIGQVLRAFAGSLRADQKHRLCREAFDVGLRTTTQFIKYFENDQEDMVAVIADRIKADHPELADKRVYLEVSRKLLFLVEQFAMGVLRHLSAAVGSSRIDPTLRRCLRDDNTTDKIIELAIKLDHYREFPLSLAEELKDGGGSRFAACIVRDLVWYNLHIVERRREIRQKACEVFEFELMPALLYNKDIKRLPGRN